MINAFKDLIVIEGSDGSGKKTKSEILLDYIHKNSSAHATILDFPDYDSDTGRLIGAMLSGRFGDDASELNPYFTSPMYALDRYQYLDRYIRNEKFWPNTIGICNRYVDSNIIHQGCRLTGSDLVEYWNWLYDFEFNKLGIPRPSIVIYLDLPFEVSYTNVVNRAKENGITTDIIEQRDYMEMVYTHVHKIATITGWKMIDCYDKELNNMKPREEIAKEIRKTLYHTNLASRAIYYDFD